MGQAKRRGTQEQRINRAMLWGRSASKKTKHNNDIPIRGMFPGLGVTNILPEVDEYFDIRNRPLEQRTLKRSHPK